MTDNNNNKNKNTPQEEIDLEKLEKLILISTWEVIENLEYTKILKDKDNEEEITKIYKIK